MRHFAVPSPLRKPAAEMRAYSRSAWRQWSVLKLRLAVVKHTARLTKEIQPRLRVRSLVMLTVTCHTCAVNWCRHAPACIEVASCWPFAGASACSACAPGTYANWTGAKKGRNRQTHH
jgi:hypothetical protein